MRKWNDKENQIIRDNYIMKDVMTVVRLLHDAGFLDRDYLSVIKQASKLKVKRAEHHRKTRILNEKKTLR